MTSPDDISNDNSNDHLEILSKIHSKNRQSSTQSTLSSSLKEGRINVRKAHHHHGISQQKIKNNRSRNGPTDLATSRLKITHHRRQTRRKETRTSPKPCLQIPPTSRSRLMSTILLP
ncbi:hypothetical protein TNCV_1091561 [Trichonephila clavipes]|nr:hypothetical protein TNCV_1091561 [Trichonephila clavipes]